ncbi:MAG: DNA-binding protein [Phycisphaerales bacterium]|nr:MAG: DNA-binding protein [Phycisphaerales bacterium]
MSDRTNETGPLLLTAADVAKLLRLSRRSVLKLRSRGAIPEPVRLGRSVRWRREELARWIAAGCPAAEGVDSVSAP